MAECAGGCGSTLTGRQKKWCSEADCRKKAQRDRQLRLHFDITTQEYEDLLHAQNGVCGVCKRPPRAGRNLAVDHEHTEGQRGPIRGLLCFFCNRRVVGARSADSIIAAAAYVLNPPAQQLWGERIAPGRPKSKKQPRKRRRK